MLLKIFNSSNIGHGLESLSGQTKDYKIGYRCFSFKYAEIRGKSKECLARNQDHVIRVKRHVYQLTDVLMS